MKPFLGCLLFLTLASASVSAQPASFVAGFDAYDFPWFTLDLQLGDLNGDHYPDLVALGQSDNTWIMVRLNRGDGTFGDVDTTMAPWADGAILADLDGDQVLDVVVHTGSAFSWFHGNGDGSLGARYDFGTATAGVFGAVATDVDGDGDADVVIAAQPAGLQVWRNAGDGTFAAPVSIATGRVQQMVAGRWNADASTDLAVQEYDPAADSLCVLLNDGAGNFTVTQRTGPMYGIGSFVADANRDGALDVVTYAEVFLGDGNGAFAAPVLLGDPCVAAGNLEPDDGWDELLFTSLDRLVVRRKLGDPPLGTPSPASVAPPGASWRVVDVNLDGYADAVSWNYTSRAVTVHPGRGIGRFGDPNASPVPAVWSMRSIRSNDDGIPDVVTIGQGWFNDVYVVPGTGPHAFGTPVTLSIAPQYCIGMAVGDVNADGIDDVVMAHDNGGVSVAFGHGDGSYDPPAAQSLDGWMFNAIDAGDLNGDGRADIAGFTGADTVVVALAGPGGVFASPVTHAIGWFSTPVRLQIADVTGDDLLDVVALDNGGGLVVVLPGTGTGALGAPVISSRLSNGLATDLAVGRLDGDAIPDLVVVNATSLERLLGSATGAFTAMPLLPTVRAGTGVAVADLDLDGDADVAITSTLTNAVHVYTGDGTGALTFLRGFGSGGVAPTDVLVTDMDGNGRPDLVLGNYLSNDLSVLQGLPLATTVPPPGMTGTLALAVSPNPAPGLLQARFSLPYAGDVVIEMVDLQGRRVVNHALGQLTPGPHTIPLDATRLSSGLYWVRLRHPVGHATQRVAIVR